MRLFITTVLFVILCLGFLLISCGKSVEPTPVTNNMVPYHGDINVNGVSYEIADAVMFTNYFIVGTDAFGSHVDSSVAASEVNGNGVRLEVSDLQYMIRYIQGEAYSIDRLTPITDSCLVYLTGDRGTYVCQHDIGAMLLTCRVVGTAGTPLVSADMDIHSSMEGDTLRVLVYNIGNEYLESGTHEIINLNISGSVELIGAEVSSYDGVTIPVKLRPY
ncbi:MAG: hypothetical protein R3F48_06955 [Candidatus Zixiibacteriota bacterium]